MAKAKAKRAKSRRSRAVRPKAPRKAARKAARPKVPRKATGQRSREQAVGELREVARRLKVKTEGRKATQQRRMQETLREYIRKSYVPKDARRREPTAKEIARIQARTTPGRVARRVGDTGRTLFELLPNGAYRVIDKVGRFKRGQFVSASTVRRSMSQRAYQAEVRIVRETLGVSHRSARDILRAAQGEWKELAGVSPKRKR